LLTRSRGLRDSPDCEPNRTLARLPKDGRTMDETDRREWVRDLAESILKDLDEKPDR